MRDYIARIRAQMVRVLGGLGVTIPPASIGSVHSIRVTLAFIDNALEECRPKRMTGYGELLQPASISLAGLVDELQGIIARVDAYLAQGQSADLEHRLQRLEQSGGDVELVKQLGKIIDRYGLVEFRPALATIIERLESNRFEIAVFGRVSSGKSSLLNHILGVDVLPVGVNPITAVPTRLIHGLDPHVTVSFADHKPERFPIEQLADFATEQNNPSNSRHVTRIVVELPAARLSEGIVYVDTPGLGSLATSGAAETKAYLPRCDLGVVLIDAGSTLTAEDIATIQALYDAGIPASVLLSKSDLLAAKDRERAREYAAEQIRSNLNLDLTVHSVSCKAEYGYLLENWLSSEILPLYHRHAELARQSLQRKIGHLRLGLEASLSARLRRRERPIDADRGKLRETEADLRAAAGRIAEARAQAIEMADAIRVCADELLRSTAIRAIDGTGETSMRLRLEEAAAEKSNGIAALVRETAVNAGGALADAGKALNFGDGTGRGELIEVIQNMPRFDLGDLKIEIANGLTSWLGRPWAVRHVQRQLRSQAGQGLEDALVIYARVMQSWVRKTFTELQEHFDSRADAYRAQLARLIDGGGEGRIADEALQHDLSAIRATVQTGICS